jgi:thiol-disulfide isomerase/thioredoxin
MQSYIKIIIIVLIILFLGYRFFYNKEVPALPIQNTILSNAEGKELMLSKLINEVYIVSFFKSWCGDCRRELPELEALQEAVGGESALRIFLVSDEDWTKINQVKTHSKSTLDFYQSSKTLKEIGIKRYPTTYLIDKNGNIVTAKVEGIYWNTAEIISQIKKLNQ